MLHPEGRNLSQAEQILLKVRDRFHFLNNMSDNEVLSIVKNVCVMKLKKGEILFKQGQAGDAVFIVIKGGTSVQIDKPDGARLEVAKLYHGAIFGEMSPITKEDRSATIISAEDETILLSFKLSVEIDERISLAYAKLYYNITFILADKIKNQNKLQVFTHK